MKELGTTSRGGFRVCVSGVFILFIFTRVSGQIDVTVRNDLSAPGQTWNSGRQQCQQLGGDLAKITSFSDNSLLCSSLPDGDYYIGLLQSATLSHSWLDNVTHSPAGWDNIKPDGDVGDDVCVVVRKITGITMCSWYKKLCDHEFGFVCSAGTNVTVVPKYVPVSTDEMPTTSSDSITTRPMSSLTYASTASITGSNVTAAQNDCSGLLIHDEWMCVAAGILSQPGDLTSDVSDTFFSFLQRNPLTGSGVSREDAIDILQKFIQIIGKTRPSNGNGDSEAFDRSCLKMIDGLDEFGDDVIEYMRTEDIDEIKITEYGIDSQYNVMEKAGFKGLVVHDTEMENKLKIPADIHGGSITETEIGIATTIYGTAQDFPSMLNSELEPIVSKIISCSVFPKPQTPIPTEVEIIFRHNSAVNYSKCVYLDETVLSLTTPVDLASSVWATEGCRTVEYSVNQTICKCNHLTSFAVLMQPTAVELSDAHKQALSIITYAGCSISVVCLFTTFATLIFFRLASDRVLILQNTIMAILLAQLTFIVGISATKNRYVCMFVAVLLHYLFLAAFSWMLAQGIHLFIKARAIFISSRKLVYLCALGWGIPLPIVAISAGIKWDHYGNQDYCWLSMNDGLPAAFIVPAMTVVLVNIIVLILVLRAFMGVRANAKKSDMDKIRAGLRAGVILVPLLGLTWLFGLFSVNEAALYFQYLFAIANSLQGFFIFLFHCCLNEEVRSAYRKRFGGPVSYDETTKSTANRRSAWQETSTSNTKVTIISATTTT